MLNNDQHSIFHGYVKNNSPEGKTIINHPFGNGLPSGELTVRNGKWPSRNSGFSQLQNGGFFSMAKC